MCVRLLEILVNEVYNPWEEEFTETQLPKILQPIYAIIVHTPIFTDI